MISLELLLLISGASTSLAVMLTMLALRQLSDAVPEDDQEFKDPLPAFLAFIWPLIRIIAYFCCSRLPFSYLQMVEKRLQKNGVSYLMIAEEYEALRVFSAGCFLMLGWVGLWLADFRSPVILFLLPLLGAVYPDIWLHDIRRKQTDAVLRTLPAYLDFITMSVEAGLNFSGAIAQAREKGTGGPLVNEFGIVLRDLRAGLSRSEALQRMARRLDIHEVTSFINAVIQAEKMGSSLASILRAQARQRRSERFQRAEKKAMEAPIKLLGPLMLFIFPTTFIVLAFPLVIQFLHGGLF